MSNPEPSAAARHSVVWRWWPVAALLLAVALVYGTGLNQHITLASVAQHRDLLKGFARDHWTAAVLVYVAAYVAMAVASLPAAAMMSVAGGFLFGWYVSAPLSVLAATLGATIVFQIVRTTAGHTLAERAGPMAKRLSGCFAADAFHYLLFLRLLPVFPFFVVNAVAGLCRVRVSTFIAATLLGIIPGALAYAWLGSGLDSVIVAQRQAYDSCVAANGVGACTFHLETSALLTPQLVVALLALAAAALVPLAVRHLMRRRTPA